MDCHLNDTFIDIRNSGGLTIIIGSRIHGSQLMRNLLNLLRQYGKRQTRVKEVEKSLG